MCMLLPEDLLPRSADGGILRGGLFAVAHKNASDRLINDRRPLNEVEGRLHWAELPVGWQLTQLVVSDHQSVVASGDDLQSRFHCLRHRPECWPRNTFSRRLDGVRLDSLWVRARWGIPGLFFEVFVWVTATQLT
jgi:hypothetical protein